MDGWRGLNSKSPWDINSVFWKYWHSSESERDELEMRKMFWTPVSEKCWWAQVVCGVWILLNWIFTCSHIGHHNILAQGRASYFGFLRSSTHESVVLQCIEMLKCWLCTFLNRCLHIGGSDARCWGGPGRQTPSLPEEAPTQFGTCNWR